MNLNRSYNMGERQINNGKSLGAVIKEKDEELALFLEMRKREKEEKEKERERERSIDLIDPTINNHRSNKAGGAPIYKIVPTATTTVIRKAGIDDFLNSDSDKNDYDWLLTPPGTPLFPSLDTESKRSPVSHAGTPKTRPTALKSRLANPQDQSTRVSTYLSRTASSNSLTSAVHQPVRRPGSSGGPPAHHSSRPATPTGRPTLSNPNPKPSRPSTPTSSRQTLTLTGSKPAPPSKPVSRSSTPSSRSTIPSARSTLPSSRSTTPSRSMSQSQTKPTNTVPTSRSSTPTRRTINTSTTTTTISKPAPPVRSSSVSKAGPTLSKPSARSVPATRGSSPTVRSRPWKPSDMPGFSLDAPPNLRTSIPSDRPSSVTRGRPAGPTARSASVEAAAGPANSRARRQSCSPLRGRAPNNNNNLNNNNNNVRRVENSVNPVAIGNKMVERVVHMRRLAPPKQEEQRGVGPTGMTAGGGKSVNSPDSGGFGRTLSKKSLDMALRHMDIRRSIPNNLRPLMTNIPASSVYSVRSGSSVGPASKGRQLSVSDSPLATSSNTSSEPSVNNLICLESTEMDEDFVGGSERGLMR